ncbi:MAG TPA: hypothetical protein PLW93_01160 [Candidatus Absconditabacterales bacterium]|nr:hypothetical protein [Candidatus Absconditabacterales bacterium]HNG96861.1 hypothetical protein [Candidatus Absconditabacterales bacterium]
MVHIGLVGFGAVGFVIKQAFTMIKPRYDVLWTVYVRNPDRVRMDYGDDILHNVTLVKCDVTTLDLTHQDTIKTMFGGLDYIVQSSLPEYNDIMMQVALIVGSHYIDLASLITSDMLGRVSFPQRIHHDSFANIGKIALINAGVSPGLTECVLAQLIYDHPHQTLSDVSIILQEQLYTDHALPSWSPQTAIQELTTDPVRIENGRKISCRPFANDMKQRLVYKDEYGVNDFIMNHYPLFQEELMSIYDQYPHIVSCKMYTGGGEVQQLKTLYDFGLLSDVLIDGLSQTFKELIIKQALPTATRKQMIEAYTHHHIDTLYFGAIISAGFESGHYQKTISFDYQGRRSLEGTPCRGATYISFPTGYALACMLDNLICMQNAFLGGVYSVFDWALLYPFWTSSVLQQTQQGGIIIKDI